jgi:cell division transport system permease protein
MISYYFKETLRIFKRSPFATIVTISITALAILLCTMSYFVILISNDFSKRVKQNIEVSLYLSDTLTENDIAKIKEKLLNKKVISNLKFIDKTEATKDFIAETGQDFASVLNSNPLPNSFLVKFDSKAINEITFDKYVGELKNIDKGITDVVYDYNVIVRILKFFRSIELVVYITAIVLLVLSIYLVYINHRLQYENNKNLYKTMKLVGSKLRLLKIPYILNGIFIGLIASIICVGINVVVIRLLTAINININLFHKIESIHLIPVIIGILLGFIGSFFSSLKMSLRISEVEK